MIREPSVVVLDYYETLAELSTSMREQFFDEISYNVGARLQPGEAFRHWRERIINDAAVRLGGAERPSPDGPAPPFVSFRETWLTRFGDLYRLWDVDEPAEKAANEYASVHAQARVYPDVRPAIEALRGRFRLGLLADADRDFLEEGIALNGLNFDAVVTSEDMGVYKPHISMFRTVCERLGVSPRQAVYVGDRPWADIEGARNAGLTPVWINRSDDSWPGDIEPPANAVSSLTEVVELLT